MYTLRVDNIKYFAWINSLYVKENKHIPTLFFELQNAVRLII